MPMLRLMIQVHTHRPDTSGAKLWVRVRALGPKGLKSPWSDPAVKRVP